MKIFGHALYLSEDLLLPPNYFLINFKEIPSIILAKKVGGGFPPFPVATTLIMTYTISAFNSIGIQRHTLGNKSFYQVLNWKQLFEYNKMG